MTGKSEDMPVSPDNVIVFEMPGALLYEVSGTIKDFGTNGNDVLVTVEGTDEAGSQITPQVSIYNTLKDVN